MNTAPIVIGLSAVIVAVRAGEAVALTVRPHDPATGEPSTLPGLPSGPFDPDGHRTFELALRDFVRAEAEKVIAHYASQERNPPSPAPRRVRSAK